MILSESAVFYKASDKKILTDDEWKGVKTTSVETLSYFVQIQELKTLDGIKPAKKWFDLTIVFPKAPSRKEAYEAIATEVEKIADKGLDINAYVSAGEKGIRTSWQQVRDNDGGFIFANYSAATGKTTRQGVVISFRREKNREVWKHPNCPAIGPEPLRKANSLQISSLNWFKTATRSPER